MCDMDEHWILFCLTLLRLPVLVSLGGDTHGLTDNSAPDPDASNTEKVRWVKDRVGLYMAVEKEDDEKDLETYRLSPQSARTVLLTRHRRGWWWEEEEERDEARERNSEAAAREATAEHLARTCPYSCWGAWGAFSVCSVDCGSTGTKWRYRSISVSGECVGWVQANGCPGSSSQSAACNRFCQAGGTLLATSCSCPPSHTGTCCRTAVTCGHPGTPSNGEVTPTGGLHHYAAVVHFSCHVGYEVIGATSRTCLTTGQWSNAVPTCSLVDCGHPGIPINGHVSGDVYTYDAVVTFSCDTGYDLVGDGLRQCGENGMWSGSQPECQVVTCPAPVSQDNGEVLTPEGVTYGQTAIYRCDEGYYLLGSEERTCTQDGVWSGSQPDCEVIMCPDVSAPTDGSVECVSTRYGSSVTYSCDHGYLLQGHPTRVCRGTGPVGVWSGQPATCQAVDCGDPGTVENGVLASPGGTSYPSGEFNVQCFAGFYMIGASQASCQPEGEWSHALPQCQACPLNTYKEGVNTASSCDPCPPHSSTALVASASMEQCGCVLGYKGPSGGPCTEIVCSELPTPSHSEVVTCQRTYGQVCYFTCEEGHIWTSGDQERRCQLNEQWSGSQLVCTACEIDQYKSAEDECSYCPEHSNTDGEGNGWDGCICDAAFTGPDEEGACRDIDECDEENGGCEQMCENEVGGHKCRCNLPGHIPLAEDPARCQHKNNCPDLEAVENGGLVCVLEEATSTRRCQVRCNYGYEHLIRPNAFEECGPSTGWQWSTELNNRQLMPCTEAFFPEIQLELSMFYFTGSCDVISAVEKDDLKQSYLDFLREDRSLCDYDGFVCHIEDVTIQCGVSTQTDEQDGFNAFTSFNWWRRRRRRRSAAAQVLVRFRFRLRVEPIPQLQVDCDLVCGRPYSQQYCQDTCLDNYRTYLQDTLHSDSTALFLSNENETVTLTDGVTLYPYQPPTFRPPSISCGSGMITIDGVCGACPAGSYQEDGECLECPRGTHQPTAGSDGCLSCPSGTYQDMHGQTSCTPCSAGHSQSAEGATSCSRCPWAYATGTSDCTALLLDVWESALSQFDESSPCIAGTYHPVAGDRCEECPAYLVWPHDYPSCRHCPWLLPWDRLNCHGSRQTMRNWLNEAFQQAFDLFSSGV